MAKHSRTRTRTRSRTRRAGTAVLALAAAGMSAWAPTPAAADSTPRDNGTITTYFTPPRVSPGGRTVLELTRTVLLPNADPGPTANLVALKGNEFAWPAWLVLPACTKRYDTGYDCPLTEASRTSSKIVYRGQFEATVPADAKPGDATTVMWDLTGPVSKDTLTIAPPAPAPVPTPASAPASPRASAPAPAPRRASALVSPSPTRKGPDAGGGGAAVQLADGRQADAAGLTPTSASAVASESSWTSYAGPATAVGIGAAVAGGIAAALLRRKPRR